MVTSLKIKKLDEGLPTPEYAHAGDAGMDLRASEGGQVRKGTVLLVGTGVAVAIPEGYVGLVFGRSGLGIKKGIQLANCVGVIDSGYRGEIKVGLVAHSGMSPYKIERGDRIAQLVVVPVSTFDVEVVEDLDETVRGDGGFGSSGR